MLGLSLGKEFPPRCLVVGIPADIKKQLPSKGKMEGEKSSAMYVENGNLYKKFFENNPEFT